MAGVTDLAQRMLEALYLESRNHAFVSLVLPGDVAQKLISIGLRHSSDHVPRDS